MCVPTFQEHKTESHYLGKLTHREKKKHLGAYCPLLIAPLYVRMQNLWSIWKKIDPFKIKCRE